MPVRSLSRVSLRKSYVRAASLLVLAMAVCVGGVRPAQADGKSALPPGVDTFKMTKPVQTFSPATLENHIDGQAESVKKYDFKQCDYAEYAPGGKGTQLITVDIYTMGSPLDSYGYYSYQLGPSAKGVKFVKLGNVEGYQTGDSVNFWKGPYYVVITNTTANAPPSFAATMPKIASAVAAKLTGAQTPPAGLASLLTALPPGYTPHSEVYQRTDVFAQTFLKNGIVAKYPIAGPQSEAFVVQLPSADAAKQAYTQYSAYLTQPTRVAIGAKPQPLTGIGSGAVVVRSKVSGFYGAAQSGKYVIGIRRAKDAVAAQTWLKTATAKLK